MSGHHWFRMSESYTHDPDLVDVAMRLSGQFGQEHGCLLFAYWPAMIAKAKASRDEGRLPVMTPDLMRALLPIQPPAPDQFFRRMVELLAEFGRLGVEWLDEGRKFRAWFPSEKWAKWQTNTDAERARRYRERQKEQRDASRDVTVASRDAFDRPMTHDPIRVSKETPPTKRAVPSAEKVLAEIEECRKQFGMAAQMVDSLCDLMAEQNKTGKVAQSRCLRVIYRPIAEAMRKEGLSPEAIRHGAQAALAGDAPNPNYVLKAARSYRPFAMSSNGAGRLAALPNPKDDPDVEWIVG